MSASDAGAAAEVTARIELGAANPSLELTVVGADFNPVAAGIGRLEANVPPGIYQIVTRAGPAVERRLVSLEPGETHRETGLQLAFPSAAPVQGTSTTHEYHQELAAEATRKARVMTGIESWLVVIVRDVRGTDGPPLDPAVVRRVELLDRDMRRIPGFADGWDVREHEAAAAWSGGLASGPYVLRTEVAGGVDGSVDQSLWLQLGWQTVVFMTIGPTGPEPASASVHLVEMALEWSPFDERLGQALELAGWALREGRPVVPTDLLDILLNSKFRNPMLGLIGAHALLLRPNVDQALLDQVTANLDTLIPGHPDLVALRWIQEERRAAEMRSTPSRPAAQDSVDWPPMLLASYRALIRMDALDPGAIRDGSLAERIAGNVTVQGIWTTWRPIAAESAGERPAPPEQAAEAQPLEALLEWEVAAPQPSFGERAWYRRRPAQRPAPARRGAPQPQAGAASPVAQLARRRYQDPATARVARYLANVAELEGPQWAAARFAEITTAELALATLLPSGRVNRSLRELRQLAMSEAGGGGGSGGGSGGGGTPDPFRLPLVFLAALVFILGGGIGLALGLAVSDGYPSETASPSPTAEPTVTPTPTPTATPEPTLAPVAIPRIDPRELVFGVVVGFDERRLITIHNDGNAPFLIRAISPSIDEFEISGDCGRVEPGDSCSLDVVFSPSAVGRHEAVLAIDAADFDRIDIPLYGFGLAEGSLDVSPPALNLANTPPPGGHGVAITASDLVRIEDISLAGETPDAYRIDDPSPCETALAQGETCFVRIDYVGNGSCFTSYPAEFVITTSGGKAYLVILRWNTVC